MDIILSPQRRDDTLTLIKTGDVLNVNGEDFDFSPMGAGDTLPYQAITSQWFVAAVEKDLSGKLTLTVILPNPANYSPEQAFPVPLLDIPDGPVELPQPLPDGALLAGEGEFTE